MILCAFLKHPTRYFWRTEGALPTLLYYEAQFWPQLPQSIFHEPLTLSIREHLCSHVAFIQRSSPKYFKTRTDWVRSDMKICKPYVTGAVTWVLSIIVDVNHHHLFLRIITNICQALLCTRDNDSNNIISFTSLRIP